MHMLWNYNSVECNPIERLDTSCTSNGQRIVYRSGQNCTKLRCMVHAGCESAFSLVLMSKLLVFVCVCRQLKYVGDFPAPFNAANRRKVCNLSKVSTFTTWRPSKKVIDGHSVRLGTHFQEFAYIIRLPHSHSKHIYSGRGVFKRKQPSSAKFTDDRTIICKILRHLYHMEIHMLLPRTWEKTKFNTTRVRQLFMRPESYAHQLDLLMFFHRLRDVYVTA